MSKNGKTLEDLFEFYFSDEDCQDNKVLGFLEGINIYYGFAVLKGNKDNIKCRCIPK